MSFPPYTYTRTQQFLPPLWVAIMQDEYCRSDYHVNRKATFSFAVALKKCINHDFQFRTHFNKKDIHVTTTQKFQSPSEHFSLEVFNDFI